MLGWSYLISLLWLLLFYWCYYTESIIFMIGQFSTKMPKLTFSDILLDGIQSLKQQLFKQQHSPKSRYGRLLCPIPTSDFHLLQLCVIDESHWLWSVIQRGAYFISLTHMKRRRRRRRNWRAQRKPRKTRENIDSPRQKSAHSPGQKCQNPLLHHDTNSCCWREIIPMVLADLLHL